LYTQTVSLKLYETRRSPATSLTKETIVRRLRESYPQLTAQFGVERIGLFGSFARETARSPATST